MLSKVNSSGYYFNDRVIDTFDKTFNTSDRQTTLIKSISVQETEFDNHRITVNFSYSSWSSGYAGGSKILCKVDGGDYIEKETLSWSGTVSFSENANTTLDVYIQNKQSYWYTFYITNSEARQKEWIKKLNMIPKGKPREFKWITEKVSTTIFGIHTDNSRVTQDAE